MGGPYDRELSRDLRAFLHSSIDSLEQLEILLLLRRTGRPWSLREIAAELSLTDSVSRREAEALVARGLVERAGKNAGTFHHHPRTPELDRMCALLDDTYTTSPLLVIAYIRGTGRRAMPMRH